MESQIKTMKHYATDSNANKKSSEVELEEWIDGDYENQVIACMEITELRKQLHSQESEYKSLVRSCKVSIKPWLVCLMLSSRNVVWSIVDHGNNGAGQGAFKGNKRTHEGVDVVVAKCSSLGIARF
ncbi:unnamed protein product [Sphagnum jensenii]|uniref:Uncharacterized protein n=2 Tax=Sphagnum jensenii TaxID=128206 RepID=A0ABP0WUY3_9BRYO